MKFNWRQREIEKIDQALALYGTSRKELNKDGRELDRKRVVDDCLDRRNRLVQEIAEGRP